MGHYQGCLLPIKQARTIRIIEVFGSIMNRTLLLVALLCGIASCTQFSDCGSTAGNVQFKVASCDIPPCEVKSGSKFPIAITMTPSKDISQVTATWRVTDLSCCVGASICVPRLRRVTGDHCLTSAFEP